MSRFTGSLWKKSRRFGISLTGSGKELQKRRYAPGQNGANARRKVSEYGLQQQEKQKIRFKYGFNERQYRILFNEARKMKGIHGENFMIMLESRLDSLVYLIGLTRTCRQARQLVKHGHILVDGKRVDTSSYRFKPGQVITIRERSNILEIIKEAREANTFVPG